MLNKLLLSSIISKYHLGGTIESVAWKIKNQQLEINFISPNKNLVGNINVSNFPLGDSTFGIYDTTKFEKMIS